MGINQLPPQAYTRETLMQAFDWIKTQPRQVQDSASSTDALVSIYMQARRRAGAGIPTHPVSSQTFKQDLKNLADGLKHFDDEGVEMASPAAQSHHSPPSQPPQPPQQQHSTAAYSQTSMQNPPQAPHQAQHAFQAPQYHHMPPAMAMNRQMANPYAPQDSAVNHLDSKSLEVVRLVQSRFNLSSENEALRMLISLGFEKVREIFPKS